MKTIFTKSIQHPQPIIVEDKIDEEEAIQRLMTSIRFQTISSFEDPEANAEEFKNIIEFIKTEYPLVNSQLKLFQPDKYSLLYEWEGSDNTKKPVLLMAHTDVVAIDPYTLTSWEHSPFSGDREGGYIWGRGAWDDKSSLFAILESVENLLKKGYKPKRTVFISVGRDEEVGGVNGAKKIAEFLKSRDIKLDFVLDEGQVITEGILPGTNKPVAMIGIAEKGYLSVKISSQLKQGGHSCMPSEQGAIGKIGKAVTKLEENQFPLSLTGLPLLTYKTLAPELSLPYRVLMSNLWLFKPIIKFILNKKNSTRAQLHTTTAVTEISGGIKDNVLPSESHAIVNYRIMHENDIQTVRKHIEEIVGSEIKVESYGTPFEPSSIASLDSFGYHTVQKSIHETFGSIIVVPALVSGHTDSVYFESISENIYKFLPIRIKSEDIDRLHGVNERISENNYLEEIRFYTRILRNI